MKIEPPTSYKTCIRLPNKPKLPFPLKLPAIVEAKAKGKPVSFDRGNKDVINERQKFLEQSLKEADEKLEWLKENPIGTNYDVSRFEFGVSILVTPFVEFIHKKNNIFWLNDEIPRILSPNELFEFLETNNFKSTA